MSKSKTLNLALIKFGLWATIFFSATALVYHIRWFIPYIMHKVAYVVPDGQMPFLWFVIQICSNIIFLFVGLCLFKLFRKYQATGFFDRESIQVFDSVIISCVVLAVSGAIQTISNNFYEVHFSEWASAESIINLLLRSFTRLLVFKEPQTMYFLLAIILWCVKQFVTRAIFIKNENEAFI